MKILKYSDKADSHIPVKRYRFDPTATGPALKPVTNTKPFLRGPIGIDWLSAAARLPGKSLNLALALRWLVDMNGGKPAKMTAKALELMAVSEDACSDGLRRLEAAGLITVLRSPGQRPVIGVRSLDPLQ